MLFGAQYSGSAAPPAVHAYITSYPVMSEAGTRGAEGLPAGLSAALPVGVLESDHGVTPESSTPFPFAFTPAGFANDGVEDDEDGIGGLYRHLLAEEAATGKPGDGFPAGSTTVLPHSATVATDGGAGDPLMEWWAAACRQSSSGGNAADTMMAGGPPTASPACPGSPPPPPCTAASIAMAPTCSLHGASSISCSGTAPPLPPGGSAGLQQPQQGLAAGALSVPASSDVGGAASPPAGVVTPPMQPAPLQQLNMQAAEHATACGCQLQHQQLPASQPAPAPPPQQPQGQHQPHRTQQLYQHQQQLPQHQQHQMPWQLQQEQHLVPSYSGPALPQGANWARGSAAAPGNPPSRMGSTPLPILEGLPASNNCAPAGLASARSLPSAGGRVAGGCSASGRNEGAPAAEAHLSASWREAPQAAVGEELWPPAAGCRPASGAAPAQDRAHRQMQMQQQQQHQVLQPQVVGAAVQAQWGNSQQVPQAAVSPSRQRPSMQPSHQDQHQSVARPPQQHVHAPHQQHMPVPRLSELQRQYHAGQGRHPAPAPANAAFQPVDAGRDMLRPLGVSRSAPVGPSSLAGVGPWPPTEPPCAAADAAAVAPPRCARSASLSGVSGDGTRGPCVVGLGDGFGRQPAQEPSVCSPNGVQTGNDAWCMPHGYQHGHARDATSGAAPVDSLPPRPASEPVHWAVASVNSYGRRGCSSISAGNSASGFDGANSTGANGDAHGDSSDNVSQPKDLHALKHWLVMMEDEVHTRKRPRHPDGAHEQAPMAPPLRPAPMPMAPAAGQPIRRDGPVMCSQQQQRPNSGNPVQLPPRGPGGHGGWPTGPTAPPPRRATDTGVMAWQLPSHVGSDVAAHGTEARFGGPRPSGPNGIPVDAMGADGRSRKASLSADGAASRAQQAGHMAAQPRLQQRAGLPGFVPRAAATAQGAACTAAQACPTEPRQLPETRVDARVAALRQEFRQWLEHRQQQSAHEQQVHRAPGVAPFEACSALGNGAEKPAEAPGPGPGMPPPARRPAAGPVAADRQLPQQEQQVQRTAATGSISVQQLQQRQRERLQQQRHERLQKQLLLVNELQLRSTSGSRAGTNSNGTSAAAPAQHNGQISCAPIQRESLGGPRAWAHGSTNAGGVGTRQPAPHQGGQAAVAAPGGGHTGAACGPAGPSAGYQPYASEVQFQPGQQQQQLLLQQQQQQQQQQLLQQQQQQQEMLQQQHRQQRMRQQQQQLQQQQRPQELWPQRQQQGPFVASQVQQQQPAPPAAETHWPHQNGSDQANPSRGSAAPQQLHEQASCHAVVLQGGQEPYAAGSWVQDRSAHGHGALAMQPPCMLQAAHGLQGAGGSASMPQQPSSRHASQPGAGLMQQCSGPVFGAGHNAARQPEPMHQHQQAQMLAAAHPGAPFAPTQVPPQLQQQWHQV